VRRSLRHAKGRRKKTEYIWLGSLSQQSPGGLGPPRELPPEPHEHRPSPSGQEHMARRLSWLVAVHFQDTATVSWIAVLVE